MNVKIFGLPNTDKTVAFKKKFRWTFEAKSKEGVVTFPQSFVKLNARPAFPYSMVADELFAIDFEWIPNSIILTQFFTFYDNALEFSKALYEFLSKVNIQETNSGLLNLYDGCGNIIEQWSLSDVVIKMEMDDSNIEGEEVILNWSISYQKCEWINVNKNKC
jgi:hypothetical protein